MQPRVPTRIVRHARLPVWPAWQGVALLAMSQVPALRPAADALEGWFGGRVCPIQLDAAESDPFILLVHHRHSFRPLDFFRPLFSALILPEGFPAHPHRGFETVTYVLPERGGLIHRDSEGCKMRYGFGACQWMTAGRGMLHEEMWDVDAATDHELYQLWVNLPPKHKFDEPRVQLLTTPSSSQGRAAAAVEREGSTVVRRASIPEVATRGGDALVRTLAGDAGVEGGAEGEGGAQTYSPITVAHVELRRAGASHSVPLPDGWTCFVYVRRGKVEIGGKTASTYDTVYLPRAGGDCVSIAALDDGADAMVFAGEPIGAPVIASGTMVMNSEAEVQQANRDYQRGAFGVPWDHKLPDEDWARACDEEAPRRRAMFGARRAG